MFNLTQDHMTAIAREREHDVRQFIRVREAKRLTADVRPATGAPKHRHPVAIPQLIRSFARGRA